MEPGPQEVAAAPQKITCPVVSEVDPCPTDAVSVTGVPAATELTGLAAAEIASVVVVAAGAVRIVICNGSVALSAPEVPVIVATVVPGVTDGAAVRVSVLDVVVDGEEKLAVTPAGRPSIVRFTAPLNPFERTTDTVDLADAPGSNAVSDGASAIEKLDALTVRFSVVDADAEPDVPTMVTIAGPAVAPPEAVNVTVEVAVAGFGENDAVTPAGRPDALTLTGLLNPY